MTLDMGNTDKLAEFRAEAERLGIKVEPPSVNRSGVEFEVEGDTIIYALAALQGRRRAGGRADRRGARRRPFADLADFAARINPRAVNKRVLESLAAAGAFDELRSQTARAFSPRSKPCSAAPSARTIPRRSARANCSAAAAAREPIRLPAVEPWLPAERLQPGIRGGRFLSLRPSARRLRRGAEEAARADLGGVLPRGEDGRDGRPRRRHRGVAARNGAPRPATRWASSACPIRPGNMRR